MKSMATTRMSSKGQVVIPEGIRNSMGLKPGLEFLVLGENDVVILKSIKAPSLNDFDRLVNKARKQARAAFLAGGAALHFSFMATPPRSQKLPEQRRQGRLPTKPKYLGRSCAARGLGLLCTISTTCSARRERAAKLA